jgi:NUMOD3 motif
MKMRSHICQLCKKMFDRRNGKRIYQFCSRSCAQKQLSPGNRGHEALLKKWTKAFGNEIAIEKLAIHIQKRSNASAGKQNPRFGITLSPETRAKIASSCTGIPNVVKGKTYKEFYGVERAIELGKQHSNKLKSGFSSGKIKPSAYSKSAPIFRGVQLRSKLEQAAIEFLEKRDGLIFGQSLLYEDVKVTWHDVRNESHTYIIDLHDVINHIIYEVKPAWKVTNPSDEMSRKSLAAAGLSGLTYRYLTDKDIHMMYPKKEVK